MGTLVPPMTLPIPPRRKLGLVDDFCHDLLSMPLASTTPAPTNPWPTGSDGLVQQLGSELNTASCTHAKLSSTLTAVVSSAASCTQTGATTSSRKRSNKGGEGVRLRWRKPATQSTGVKKRRNPGEQKPNKRQDAATPKRVSQLIRRCSLQPPPSVPLGDVCYWWWFCPDNTPGSYRVARKEWIESQWELAKSSPVFQECVVLFAKRKRIQLAGYVPVPRLGDGYIAQKCNLLQTIRAQMQKGDREVDNIDLAAIAALAYCSLLDLQYEDARTHLNAMKALNLPKRFANASQGWLYIIGLDLRFSMFEHRLPILDYFIPKRYQQHNIPEMQDLPQDRLWQVASHSTQRSPYCPVLGEAETLDMFLRLHSLFYAWPRLAESSNPPFGHLYDLEYRIRVADARLVNLNPIRTKPLYRTASGGIPAPSLDLG